MTITMKGITMKTLAVAATCALSLLATFTASGDPVPKPPVLCLEGTACDPPVTAAPPATSSPSATASGIKTQPGWYAAHNKSIVKGWPLANIISDINNEICPNANLKGIALHANIGWLTNGSSVGTYGGSDGGGWGFTAIDAVLNALANCSSGRKYLMLQQQWCNYGSLDPSNMSPQFPAWALSPAQGGTDVSDTYRLILETQYGGAGGYCLDLADPDIVNALTAEARAYCARYESNPSFYYLGVAYDSSFPFAHGTIDEGTWHAASQSITSAARAACATTNVGSHVTYQNPNPGMGNTYLNLFNTIDGVFRFTDTMLNEASWGQSVFTGTTGGTDYRGTVRVFAEVQPPNMCNYKWGPQTPDQLFDRMRFGNGANGTLRPWWPTHIVIFMASECDSQGSGWKQWKTFISSIGGQVMNGRDSTLRTPAAVKASWCENTMTCQ
jgi:hypothetical protein